MLSYSEYLQEVAYKDLNNLKKIKNIKDLKRAAHSQGYEVTDDGTHGKHGSHGTVNIRHRKSGEPVQAAKDRGAIGGKKQGKGGELESTTVNTFADALRADMRKRGRRKPNTPEQKQAIRKQAAENKARKQRNRDPFTREHTEWWVEMFREDKNFMKEIDRIDTRAAAREEREKARAERERRKAAANERVAGKESAMRMGATERVKAREERAARNKAAEERIKDAESRARATSTKPESKPSTPKPSAPKDPAKVERQNRAYSRYQSRDNQRKRGYKNIAKRKEGVGAGIKSALGGDVVGMRARK